MPARHLHAQAIVALLQSRGLRATLNRMADGAVFVSGEAGAQRFGFVIGGPDPGSAARIEEDDRSVLAIDAGQALDGQRVLAHIRRFAPPPGSAGHGRSAC